ncbi:MAG: cupin domain-containing protein [Bacteroidota bacterium]|nr:cupin domain-containing protein [Bacteroidota bacterium]
MLSSVTEALQKLAGSPNALFSKVMQHGTMSVEIYRPMKADLQTPHAQDELYVVITGTGEFLNDGVRVAFQAGDVLFAPAGVEHRFENFTDDFATWIIFYGPVGGELGKS